jgi:uncharacterized repeat protein (TIGR03803 family)
MPSKNWNNSFSRVFSTTACAFLLCSALAAAQTTTILHQFQATNSKDGTSSYAGLLAGPHGELYGNTYQGGKNNLGIIFELIPASGGSFRYSILYSFGAPPDGQLPRGTLTRDHNGNLYGTTQSGGAFGCGTIFELSPPATIGGAWTESVLYSFNCINGQVDAANPLAGVVFDNFGNLYGTAEGGGTFGLGAIFKLTPPSTSGGAWTETVLHNFSSGHDGAEPFYGITFAGHGIFYGFTPYGGIFGNGTFYQMTAGGKETVLYTFRNSTDGGAPSGAPVLDALGNVYGTANVGGATNDGVVFEFTPPAVIGQPWTETVLYSFSFTDGFSPSGVTFGPSGVLYGTSWGGGDTSSDGVVFELIPPTSGGSWTELVLHSFNGSGDGQSVWAAPVLVNGTLYGVTHIGGTKNAGTVFAVTP